MNTSLRTGTRTVPLLVGLFVSASALAQASSAASSAQPSASSPEGTGTAATGAPGTSTAPGGSIPSTTPNGSNPSASPGSLAPSGPVSSRVDEARAHHRRGTSLFSETDFKGALVEFERAYAIAPSYRLLFDIGQTYYSLQDYARALQSFERYLDEGRAEIPQARRAQVEHDIAVLRGRVGELMVVVNVPGASIEVDDEPMGRSPLSKPVLVSAGKRRIVVSRPGRTTETRGIDVAGGDKLSLAFELVEPIRTTVVHQVITSSTSPAVVALWTGTAVLAAGAGTVGYLAVQASHDWKSMRDQRGVSADEQEHAKTKTRTLALATDALIGATAVCLGTALVVTLHHPGREPERRAPGSARLEVGPRSVGVSIDF